MATDIVPVMLDKIEKDFNSKFKKSAKLKDIQKAIKNGTATYQQANEYAIEVGSILASVYKDHINSNLLPDGYMYYNIAERVLTPTLSNNHIIVTGVS